MSKKTEKTIELIEEYEDLEEEDIVFIVSAKELLEEEIEDFEEK